MCCVCTSGVGSVIIVCKLCAGQCVCGLNGVTGMCCVCCVCGVSGVCQVSVWECMVVCVFGHIPTNAGVVHTCMHILHNA